MKYESIINVKFLSFFVALIAASLTFDLFSLNIFGSKFKIAYFLTLPIIPFLSFSFISDFLKKHFKIISYFSLIFFISFFFSHDKINSTKWAIQVLLDFYILFFFLAYFKMYKISARFFELIIFIILLPGIIQWVFIQLGLEIPFLSQTHGVFYRVNGLSYYPNFFTVAISIFFPYLLFNNKFNFKIALLSFLSIFLIIQSTSRTGLLTLIICLLLKILIPNKFSKHKINYIFIACFAFLTSFSLPEKTLDQTQKSGFDKISFFTEELKMKPSTSPLERTYIAKQALKVFLDFPFFGVGPLAYENFINQLPDSKTERYFSESLRKGLYTHHENIWIELLTNSGSIFTLSVLILIFVNFKKLFTENWISISSTISLILYYLIAGQFVQNILYPSTFVIWAVFIHIKNENCIISDNFF